MSHWITVRNISVALDLEGAFCGLVFAGALSSCVGIRGLIHQFIVLQVEEARVHISSIATKISEVIVGCAIYELLLREVLQSSSSENVQTRLQSTIGRESIASSALTLIFNRANMTRSSPIEGGWQSTKSSACTVKISVSRFILLFLLLKGLWLFSIDYYIKWQLLVLFLARVLMKTGDWSESQQLAVLIEGVISELVHSQLKALANGILAVMRLDQL